VGLGGATTVWCPTGEWREREKVIVDLQEKKEKGLCDDIF
jgi:hypothetical protein